MLDACGEPLEIGCYVRNMEREGDSGLNVFKVIGIDESNKNKNVGISRGYYSEWINNSKLMRERVIGLDGICR